MGTNKTPPLASRKPNTYLVFIKSSFGEIFVILPLLYFLKKQEKSISVTFVFERKEVYQNITQVTAYHEAIKKLGRIVVGRRAFIQHVVIDLNRCEPLYLLTCDNGIETLQRAAMSYFSNPIPVFFHHAYALHVRTDQKSSAPLQQTFIAGACVLANNRDDESHYRSMGFHADNIFFTGAQGYREEWLKMVASKNPYSQPSRNRKTVFVPIRPPHELYLTEHNYRRQIEELGQAAERFSDYLFVIKAHPRQTNDPELERLTKDHANIAIHKESTLELAAHADLTLSFWSSAILDSVAVNTPAVEFHYHETPHSQLTTTHDGNLESLYVGQGFCPAARSLDYILELLLTLDDCPWFEKHRTHFSDFFGLQDNDQVCLEQVFEGIYKEFTQRNRPLILSERRRMLKELVKTLIYFSTPKPLLALVKRTKNNR